MRIYTRYFVNRRRFSKTITILVCIPMMLLFHTLLNSKFFQSSFDMRMAIDREETVDVKDRSSDVRQTHVDDHTKTINDVSDHASIPNRMVEKMDWNDYALMERDKQQFGPGEQGKGFIAKVKGEEGFNRSKELSERHKFNVTVSSAISLERSIGDQRDEKCRQRLFLKHLPRNSVSVIIPFHNEHDTTILRTAHSVVNRSPKSLLREVVLVDDASTLDSLKGPLDDYVAREFSNVRVLHSSERLGLTKSRILGADNTTSQFLVIIDAHMEVSYNFLPPLLEQMFLDYKTVACPVIDIIDKDDFKIVAIPPERNGFSWTMQNEHLPIFPKDKENLPEPYNVPIMLGCAFAITRRWWEEIGKFDPGFKVWGEEQYELSFKTWMCGGRMVDVPCSRMAHLFRKALPYTMKQGTLGGNIVRLSMVWMDEYKDYVFQRLPKLKEFDPGDLSSQFELRKRLKCKSFHWYMTNIAPDIIWNWPPVEPPRAAWGFIKSAMAENLCVKLSSLVDPGLEIQLENCSQENLNRHLDTMTFDYNWRSNIRSRYSKLCLSVPFYTKLYANPFRLNATGQQFVWDRHRGWLVSLASGRCLHGNLDTMKVDLRPCQDHVSCQWTFQFFDEKIADAQWSSALEKMKEAKPGNGLFFKKIVVP